MLEGKLVTKATRVLKRLLVLPFLPLLVFVYLFRALSQRLNKFIWRTLPRRLDRAVAEFAKSLIPRYTEIDECSIVFVTMQGEYTCNPKYIAEEMRRRKLPLRISWVVPRGPVGPIPEGLDLVRLGSAKYYFSIARAKVVIQNGHTLQRTGVHKRDGQVWIQTWHGSLGLKRLEGAGGNGTFFDQMRAKQSLSTDLLISNSSFEDNVFKTTYWPNTSILQLGHARNDLFFNQTPELQQAIRQKVLSRINATDVGQRLLLVAPTQNDGRGVQDAWVRDWSLVSDALSRRFGGQWEVLLRLHHLDKRRSQKIVSSSHGSCYDASSYPDMQELLYVADAGITNYSSWICDFLIQKRPSFIYASDLMDYERNRGFYHPFEETPFNVNTTFDGLILDIERFDNDAFEKKVDQFFGRCGLIDDGKAAERIVDEVLNLMSKPRFGVETV